MKKNMIFDFSMAYIDYAHETKKTKSGSVTKYYKCSVYPGAASQWIEISPEEHTQAAEKYSKLFK